MGGMFAILGGTTTRTTNWLTNSRLGSVKNPFVPRRLLICVALALVAFACSESENTADEVVVYKSPTCGCCTKWENHLAENGFRVRSEKRADMAAVKDANQVPTEARACHTALVGGYIIEGHVPAADIERLLREKPNIRGLAVPNMPMGSPGMEGPYAEAYDVLALRADGTHEVFSSYP